MIVTPSSVSSAPTGAVSNLATSDAAAQQMKDILVDEDAGIEEYLVDPMEVGGVSGGDALEAPPKDVEPPTKRVKLNNGEPATTQSNESEHQGGGYGDSRWVLTAEPFDKAFSSPGFQGSSAIYFRLSLTEGSQHIIKKESFAVKYGLSLWAKALVTLLDSEGLFTFIPGVKRSPNEMALNEEVCPDKGDHDEGILVPTQTLTYLREDEEAQEVEAAEAAAAAAAAAVAANKGMFSKEMETGVQASAVLTENERVEGIEDKEPSEMAHAEDAASETLRGEPTHATDSCGGEGEPRKEIKEEIKIEAKNDMEEDFRESRGSDGVEKHEQISHNGDGAEDSKEDVPSTSEITAPASSSEAEAVNDEVQSDSAPITGPPVSAVVTDPSTAAVAVVSAAAVPATDNIVEEYKNGCDRVEINERQRAHMMAGLKHLESLTFGLKRRVNPVTGADPFEFTYESGRALTICGVEFYQCVNKIIISVISRRGQLLGRHVLEFLHQVEVLGETVELTTAALLAEGRRQDGGTPMHLMLMGGSLLDRSSHNIGLKLIAATNATVVPPPPNHTVRTAKTHATLAAIGHLRAKKATPIPSTASATSTPSAATVTLQRHILSASSPGEPTSSSHVALPPIAPPVHSAVPPAFSVLPPVPPPRIDLVGNQPLKTWNTVVDPRFHNVPDWVVSVINNLLIRFDHKLFSQLQTAWLQTYGSHIDLTMWGFSNFQDLILSMPGVALRREGNDFRVTLPRPGVVDTATMPTLTTTAPPGWADQSRPPATWASQRPSGMPPDMSVFVSKSNTASKVPPEISTRLLMLLTEHNGCNIGHLQQLWRKECGEPLDFSSLGFAKFSDLLAEVPVSLSILACVHVCLCSCLLSRVSHYGKKSQQ
eukprot:Blabericola_migrator_1__3087@NODE_18_length_22925_cov_118_464826_g15_i0_p2_GENE_NODE_18_length_22925_cov_118_464826_g15_i0NODE_18_length_22925_cov_118_464826_g15_i0_p2_ORF_typecomplete_len880_score131_83OSTHTH/PF12872_7/0_0024OSTHTH/PF12872_7/2e06BAF1_ABF1/PF04684_13/0_0093BAF1_ABF1/PF04684_13/2e03_NODE_18_length_22925_cov_118_464826_g15_i052987937